MTGVSAYISFISAFQTPTNHSVGHGHIFIQKTKCYDSEYKQQTKLPDAMKNIQPLGSEKQTEVNSNQKPNIFFDENDI